LLQWAAGYISTATFWCLGTADPIGPDDRFGHLHDGMKAPACFCDQRL
jgi:hypothetical protein